MKTTCIAMIAVMYVLPMLIVSSYGSDNIYIDTYDTSQYKYQWIEYTSELVSERKLLVVRDDEYSWDGVRLPWVVARVTYDNGDKLPCMVHFDFKNKRVVNILRSDSGDEKVKVHEVLQIEPKNAIWIKSSNGTVPDGAIEGGNIRTGETIYVCRAHDDDNVLIGMMRPRNGSCVVQNISRDNYDLLAYADDEEVNGY